MLHFAPTAADLWSSADSSHDATPLKSRHYFDLQLPSNACAADSASCCGARHDIARRCLSALTRLVVQAKLATARAPRSVRQNAGNISALLRKVKAVAQEGRETTADIAHISAQLGSLANTFRKKPVRTGAATPGAPGEADPLATHSRSRESEELEVVASHGSHESAEAGGTEGGGGAVAAADARKPRVSAFEEEWPEGMPWADAAAQAAVVAVPDAAAGLEGVKGGFPAAIGASHGSRQDEGEMWGVSSLMAQSVTSPIAERSPALLRSG